MDVVSRRKWHEWHEHNSLINCTRAIYTDASANPKCSILFLFCWPKTWHQTVAAKLIPVYAIQSRRRNKDNGSAWIVHFHSILLHYKLVHSTRNGIPLSNDSVRPHRNRYRFSRHLCVATVKHTHTHTYCIAHHFQFYHFSETLHKIAFFISNSFGGNHMKLKQFAIRMLRRECISYLAPSSPCHLMVLVWQQFRARQYDQTTSKNVQRYPLFRLLLPLLSRRRRQRIIIIIPSAWAQTKYVLRRRMGKNSFDRYTVSTANQQLNTCHCRIRWTATPTTTME